MLLNTDLISYQSPATPDGKGGLVAGTTDAYPAGTRCLVDAPRRSQFLGMTANLATTITAALYLPMPATRPGENGCVTYQIDGDSGPRTLQVHSCTDRVHAGQSHYELLLRAI